MNSFTVETRLRNEFVDITETLRHLLRDSGLREGLGVVSCAHSTAALTINEHSHLDVVHDMLLWLERAVPRRQEGFCHEAGNSDAHIKASLFGSNVLVFVGEGELVLGPWQGIFLCEFDGPRSRSIHVKWLKTT